MDSSDKENYSLMHTIFERFYTPFLMKTSIRIIVLILFSAALITHVLVIPNVGIGLDQKLSMPEDSYVLKYFQVIDQTKLNRSNSDARADNFQPLQFMEDLLSMGPPVYFVLTPGLNYSKTEVQNLICGGQKCNTDSLYTQVYSASKRPAAYVEINYYFISCTVTVNRLRSHIFYSFNRFYHRSYLSKGASSWIDDYMDWSQIGGCCKHFPNNQSFCPHSNGNHTQQALMLLHLCKAKYYLSKNGKRLPCNPFDLFLLCSFMQELRYYY